MHAHLSTASARRSAKRSAARESVRTNEAKRINLDKVHPLLSAGVALKKTGDSKRSKHQSRRKK